MLQNTTYHLLYYHFIHPLGNSGSVVNMSNLNEGTAFFVATKASAI